ncbi:hypothetical protein [Acetobacterium bakii]|uniref:Uncharacterized protein n=1 Tax=Acetobacterium bakii TaxID=52689 RepID=A0A0L6U1N6_9FIRM|nr:hypothetical protein [Acetobacterium bakii]KNZ41720.1 hypothetical protein AKG39_10340 [Acetobacterium bakii]
MSVNEKSTTKSDDVDVIQSYLNVAFFKKYTCYPNLETFLNSAGFSAKTPPEFLSIPVAALDDLVQKNTKFATWSAMVSSAGDFYFEQQMKEIKFKSI